MWWKNFLNNPHKVSLLPREHLEKSLLSSVKQLEKMNINYYNAKEKIKKLCYDYCKFVSDNELKFYDKDVTEFVGESNKQNFIQFFELSSKNDNLDEGIALAERIRNSINFTPKDKQIYLNKEKRIQQLSSIASSISELAFDTEDEYEKQNYTLASEILLRETKSLKERILRMKQNSQRKQFLIHIESSYLTLESIRLATEIHNLQDETKSLHIENNFTKQNFLLRSHIESFGDTSSEVQIKEQENAALKSRIQEIQSEISSILDSSKTETDENIDSVISRETHEVRQQLTTLELEENDLIQRQRLLKSLLRSTEEDKQSYEERQKSVEVDIKHLSDTINNMKQDIDLNNSYEEEIDFSQFRNFPSEERILELKTSISEREQQLETLSERKETYEEEISSLSNRIHILKDLFNSTNKQNIVINDNESKTEQNESSESSSSTHSYEDI
ncbi:hypothetical protein TVAG_204690 [Trichomonas vaginalis G3]|uniref:Uncharacterized protein n=1 Tax=Trichomonas vaginalis (strain ATCC PRA-98 / G3) TaxID=412133 RepID=A2EIX3_TRIV3|nr:hypothetical protein TVAGG3_0661380 [Trichomonas vaginalis G3]EAY07363.1 hypothetical protein TVAG_204690 [Trichomonas vaginalis G3]KAI5506516.1 hypothetical protein TVAGG3_0661380 [Trichomonas vaginalis G3]|eukprot:XP_001319586.1 hypothetical protein [Trichomonas vaginalis G3]